MHSYLIYTAFVDLKAIVRSKNYAKFLKKNYPPTQPGALANKYFFKDGLMNLLGIDNDSI